MQIPNWSDSSASLLRRYLETDAGQLFLAQLTSNRPSLITDSRDINKVALKASEVAGFEKCVNLIFSLAKPQEEEQPPLVSLPPLDDDSQWPAHLQPQPEQKAT
jgi:hypothetical protein